MAASLNWWEDEEQLALQEAQISGESTEPQVEEPRPTDASLSLASPVAPPVLTPQRQTPTADLSADLNWWEDEDQIDAASRELEELGVITAPAGSMRPDIDRGLVDEGVAGAQRGLAQSVGMLYGFTGMVAEGLGMEPTADWANKKALEKLEDARQFAASIEDPFEEIEDASDTLKFAVGAMTQFIPDAAISLLAGGVGGLGARAVVGSAVKSAVQGTLAKRLATNLVTRQVEKQVAAGATRAAAEKAVADQVTKRFMGQGLADSTIKRSALGGAYAVNYAQNAGDISTGILQQTGETSPGIAALAAAPNAALDTIFDAVVGGPILGKLVPGARAPRIAPGTALADITVGPQTRLGRIAQTAQTMATTGLAGGVTEGVTEGAQTFGEQLARGFADPRTTPMESVSSEEAARERNIAMATGFVGGLGLGAAGGVAQSQFTQRTQRALQTKLRIDQAQAQVRAAEQAQLAQLGEGWEAPVDIGNGVMVARRADGRFAAFNLSDEQAQGLQPAVLPNGQKIHIFVDDFELGLSPGNAASSLANLARQAYAKRAPVVGGQAEFDFMAGLPKEEGDGDYNPPADAEGATPPGGTPPGPGDGQGAFDFTTPPPAGPAPQNISSPGTSGQRSGPVAAGSVISPTQDGPAAPPAGPAPTPAGPKPSSPAPSAPSAPSVKSELDPETRDTKQAARAKETLKRPAETAAPFVEGLNKGDRVSVVMPNPRNRKTTLVPGIFAERLEDGDSIFQLEDGQTVQIPKTQSNRVSMLRPEDVKPAKPVAKVIKDQLGPAPTKAKIEQTFGVSNYTPGQTLKQTIADGNGDSPIPVLARLLKKKGTENDYLVENEGEFTNDPLTSVRQMNAGLPIYLPENQDLNLLSPDIEVTPVDLNGVARNKVSAVNLWGRTYRQGAEASDFSVSRGPESGLSENQTRGLGIFNSIYRLSPERLRRSAAGMQAARTRQQGTKMKPEELNKGLENLDPVDRLILEDSATRAINYINRKSSTKGQATTEDVQDAARFTATDDIMTGLVKAAAARNEKLPETSAPVARRVLNNFNEILGQPLPAGAERDAKADAQKAGDLVVGELQNEGMEESEARAAVDPIVRRIAMIQSPISIAEAALKSATKTTMRREANRAAATADLQEGTVGETPTVKKPRRTERPLNAKESAKVETMTQRRDRLSEEDLDLITADISGEELTGIDAARVEQIKEYLDGNTEYETIYPQRPDNADAARGQTSGRTVSGPTESRARGSSGGRKKGRAVGVGRANDGESGTVPGAAPQQAGGSGVRDTAGLSPAEQRSRALGARRFLIERFLRLTGAEIAGAAEAQINRVYEAITTILSPDAANQGRRVVAFTEGQQIADLANTRPEDLLAAVGAERIEGQKGRRRAEMVRRLAAEMFRAGAFDSTVNLLEFIANNKALPRDMQLRAKAALGLQTRGFNWANIATQIGIFRNMDGSRTTWAGLLGKDRDGGKSIAINLDNGHDRGTAYQTFLHEIQHVLNDAKWDAYYGLPGGQGLKLNKVELAAIKRIEDFWKRAVLTAAKQFGIDTPAKPTDAEFTQLGEQIYELSDPTRKDIRPDRRLAALRNPRELSVEITSSPETAELLAELGFGKADKEGRVAIKGAVKEAWDALVQLESGTIADPDSPLAMAFKASMAINFAGTGDKKVDARYTVPDSAPTRLTRELDEMRTASDFVEAELEARGLPGTSEQRTQIVREYELTRREPTQEDLDEIADPETMSRAAASQENLNTTPQMVSNRRQANEITSRATADGPGNLEPRRQTGDRGMGPDDAGRADRPGRPQLRADAYLAWLGEQARTSPDLLRNPQRAMLAWGEAAALIQTPEQVRSRTTGSRDQGAFEHHVYDTGDGKILKVLKPGRGYSYDPLEYLVRLSRLQTAVPDLDIDVTGMLSVNRSPRFVTEMARIAGEHPDAAFLSDKLAEYGWADTGNFTYLHRSGVSMTDAAPDNFIRVGDDVVPFDVIFEGDVSQPMFVPSQEQVAESRAVSETLPPVPTDPMPMSAVDVLYRDSAVLPKPAKKIKNAEVATILADIAQRYWGFQLNSENITPEIEQIIVANGVEEFISALRASGKNAADWYSTAIEVAMEVAGVIHPEITNAELARAIPAFSSAAAPDKAAQLVMRIALAVTSQNLNVNQNAGYAEEQYAIFRRTGKFDSSKIYGEKAESISGNLELANQLITKLGFEGAETFIQKEFSVDALQKDASEVLGRRIKIAGKKDDIVNGAALFGPKIGQGFLQNLMGRFSPVTIDLWMRRTWGRWTGDVVGDGVTDERMAKLLDAAREDGLQIPESLRSLRTVERKRKNGESYKTMSSPVADRLETDPDFRALVEQFAAEFNSRGQAEYRLTGQPVTPRVAASVAAGNIPYKQFIRDQQRVKDGLDRTWDRLRKDGKKPDMSKADWIAEQHRQEGRTEVLDRKVRSGLKPKWSRSAKVIIGDLNPIDIPSPQDRRVISRIVNKIREDLSNRGYSATNADIQAVLWYPEKDIWAKLTGKGESTLKLSYDDEFIAIAEKRGLGEQARAAAERIRADRAARTGGQDVAGSDRGVARTADESRVTQTGVESRAVSPQQDADYLAAVERGDMETAQRMVDGAARAAGYTMGPMYHATKGPLERNQFDPERIGTSMDRDRPDGGDAGFGFYFTPDRDYAAFYGDTIYRVFLRPEPSDRTILSDGYYGTKGEIDEYVVNDPTQIKSADAITRDDNGNVIPLSQRFNEESADIRESRAVADPEDEPIAASAVLNSGRPVNEFGLPQGELRTELTPDGELDIVDAKIDPPMRSLLKLVGAFESATDKLRRGTGLTTIASRIENYFDRYEQRMGLANGLLRRARMKFGFRGEKAALETFERYMRERENGRRNEAQQIYNNANEGQRALIDAWVDYSKQTGVINTQLRTPEGKPMQVYDSKIKKWRPIRTVQEFFPRMMRPEVQQVLQNPASDPALYNDLLDAIVDQGRAKDREGAAEFIKRDYFSTDTTQDYFAGVERGRNDPLPEIFYDYSFNTAARYMRKWAQRTAQIENFGQSTTPGTGDWFSTNIPKVRDEATRRYLTQVRDRIYEVKENDTFGTLMNWLNVSATGLQLGNPATAFLNLFGGSGLNVTAFGWKNTIKAAKDVLTDWNNVMQSGADLGIVGKDVLNILNDADMDGSKYFSENSTISQGLSKFASFTMKWGGYTDTENFIRASGMLAARAKLMDSIAANNKNPSSTKARWVYDFSKREGLNAEELIKENGQGPETAKFLRKAVNVPQGSYRIDMTPVYVDVPLGRFLFKYQKFGTQLTRMFWKHHLQPFIEKPTPANFSRLLHFFGAALGAGTVIGMGRAALFGYQDPGPDEEDFKKVLEDKDTARAWSFIFSRAWHSMNAAGALGFFGNYLQFALDWRDQQRVKNPLQPPGLASIDAVLEILNRLREQGTLTGKDLDEIAESTLSLYRANKRIGLSTLDAVGADWNLVREWSAEKQIRMTRKYTRWYADENEIESKRSTPQGRVAKTPMSPTNTAVTLALRRGDYAAAKIIMDQALAKAETKEERAAIKASLESSVRIRQPITIAGSAPSIEQRREFFRWAKQNAPGYRYEQMRRDDENYRKGAARLGISIR
jgi:hypothetical protein